MKAKRTESLTGSALDSDALLQLVRAGSLAAVRRHFDRSLASLPYVRPDWSHLKAALETGNRDMMKLLVTWGAKPSENDLKSLAEQSPRQFDNNLLLLRLAGIFLSKEIESLCPALTTPEPVKEDYQSLIKKIPQDWINVLKALQANKAQGAFIAGGALRDLLNEKPVNDVDIFIPNMDPMMVERYLKKIFSQAGMNCYEIEGRDSYWDNDWGRVHGFSATKISDKKELPAQLHCTSWKIYAGSDRNSIIPYNVIFVGPKGAGVFARTLFAPVVFRPQYTLDDVLPKFDIGLCQIAFDGKKIITTEAFEHDQAAKTLTVSNPNGGTREHLQRLQKKYPDSRIENPHASMDALPEEWLKLFAAIQKKAPEALIAGGALRDTFNERAVKDVDIFLCDRRFQQSFIKGCFKAAGLRIKPQTTTRSDGYSNIQILEDLTQSRAPAFEQIEQVVYKDSYGDVFTRNKLTSTADSWTVVSAATGAEYNIVFLSGEIEKALRGAKDAKDRAQILTSSFDIGLCQIATDGKDIFETDAYRLDVAAKRLTLLRPNHSSLAHLDRMIQKYPDFALCPAAAKLTGKKDDGYGGPR